MQVFSVDAGGIKVALDQALTDDEGRSVRLSQILFVPQRKGVSLLVEAHVIALKPGAQHATHLWAHFLPSG